MSKIVFYLGGARSGKSRLAQERFSNYQRVAYIATAKALDSEMAQRIQLHQQTRPAQWVTIEEPLDLARAFQRAIESKPEAILLDCLTLWLSNKLLEHEKDWNYAQEQLILNELQKAIEVLQGVPQVAESAIVSNEVGSEVVPANALARSFRDLAGRANQLVASMATEVNWVVAGLPMRLK